MGLADWVLVGLIVACGAVLSSLISFEVWGVEAAKIPGIIEAVDRRLTSMQTDQAGALERVSRLSDATRAQLDAVKDDQAAAREKVAKLDGLMDTHNKWQKKAGNRLDVIDQKLTAAKKVVEHTDAKLEQIVPADPPAWWKVWR